MTVQQHSIVATAGKDVELADGGFATNAQFSRDGIDLLLTSPEGQSVRIEGYFNQNPLPTLTSPQGMHLSPDMVNAFLLPQNPAQYAENTTAGTASDVSPIGKITQVSGDAFVIHADGTRVHVTLGTLIHQGDVIETSAKGAVSILFADNTTFAISESARLSVDEFNYNAQDESGSSFFSMLQGAFVYTSGLIGKSDPADVNINTPVGSIGIRGTVIAGIIHPAGQDSTITILDGSIVVSNTAGTLQMSQALETVTLNSQQETPASSGQMQVADFSSTYGSLTSVAGNAFHGITADTHAQPVTQPAAATAPLQDEAAPPPAGEVAPPPTSIDLNLMNAPHTLSPTLDAPIQTSGGFGGLLNTVEGTAPLSTVPFATLPPALASNDPLSIAALPLIDTTLTATLPTSSNTSQTIGSTALPPPPSFYVTFDYSAEYIAKGGMREFAANGTVIGHITLHNASGSTFVYNFDGATPLSSTYGPLNAPVNYTANASGPSNPFAITTTGDVIVNNGATLFYDNAPSFSFNVIGDDGTHNATASVNVNVINSEIDSGSTYLLGTSGNDVSGAGIVAGASSQVVFGFSGNDTIRTYAGNDVIFAGFGDDYIMIKEPMTAGQSVKVDGGDGSDRLVMGGVIASELSFDLTSGQYALSNIEYLETGRSTVGDFGHNIYLNIQNIFDMTTAASNHTLTVRTALEEGAFAGGHLTVVGGATDFTVTTGSIGLGQVILQGTYGGQGVTLIVEQGTDGGGTDGVGVTLAT